MKNNTKRFLAIAAGFFIAATGFGGASVIARADEVVSDDYAVVGYAGGSTVSYYLDANDTLYVAGSNGSGEFGDGSKGTTRHAPKAVMDHVAAVAYGKSGFALALKQDGTLLGWGNNKFAQLGQNTDYNDDEETNCILTPTEITVPSDSPVVAIAAGAAFSVVLTRDGSVFTCGQAGYGQTGIADVDIGKRKEVVGKMTQIAAEGFDNKKIKAIEATENAGFALAEDGSLYVWGANDEGILGAGSVEIDDMNETPKQVALDGKVKDVSAKTMTVLVQTEDGKVYGWGDNSVGQLGVASETATAVGSPMEIDKFYDPDGAETEIEVREILCGGRTNFVLSTDGRVFAFGAAGAGEAGCNVQSGKYLTHPCVRESNVVSPMEIAFYHAVSLENATEEVLEFYKDKIPVDMETPVEVTVDVLVGSAGSRTFVRDEDGNMWSWGDNAYGMACSGDEFTCTAPVRSTRYRKDNFDKTYEQKNYLLKPAIVMGCVVAFAIFWFVRAEIKIRIMRKKQAAEAELLMAGKTPINTGR